MNTSTDFISISLFILRSYVFVLTLLFHKMGRHFETVMTVLQLVEDLTRKCIWDTVDSHLSVSLCRIGYPTILIKTFIVNA